VSDRDENELQAVEELVHPIGVGGRSQSTDRRGRGSQASTDGDAFSDGQRSNACEEGWARNHRGSIMNSSS
jgi:hypothetical protein